MTYATIAASDPTSMSLSLGDRGDRTKMFARSRLDRFAGAAPIRIQDLVTKNRTPARPVASDVSYLTNESPNMTQS